MVLLDTNHMSILERETPEPVRLKARLAAVPRVDVATTIVSYEEQTRGWLAVTAQARTAPAHIAAYDRLQMHLRIYCKVTVVGYDWAAVAQYELLRQMRLRIGTMDLRIAAIALANNATLLTRNLADIGRIPGLLVQDWAA